MDKCRLISNAYFGKFEATLRFNHSLSTSWVSELAGDIHYFLSAV